jgi:hypothetical protein
MTQHWTLLVDKVQKGLLKITIAPFTGLLYLVLFLYHPGQWLWPPGPGTAGLATGHKLVVLLPALLKDYRCIGRSKYGLCEQQCTETEQERTIQYAHRQLPLQNDPIDWEAAAAVGS